MKCSREKTLAENSTESKRVKGSRKKKKNKRKGKGVEVKKGIRGRKKTRAPLFKNFSAVFHLVNFHTLDHRNIACAW
jgi:hypothetical protein